MRGLQPNLGGLGQLVSSLSAPQVDIAFTLERLISDGSIAAARIFGEGTITFRSGPLFALFGTREHPRAHLTISTVSMFRIAHGLIAERWGPVGVERSLPY